MSGFPTIQLGEVTTKVGSGSTPRGGESAYKSTGTPLIRSMNVHFDGFREDGLAHIDDDQAAALRNVEVRARDVLLNITGASIGRVTIAPPHMDGARVNQHVCIIRPDDRLEPSFLRWFLASPLQQRLINSMESGATRQALTKEKILAFEVPLPSLDGQREIVAELEKQFSRLDEAVANLQRVKANLKRYKASVLKAAVEGRLVETEATLARREGRAFETGEQLLQRILEGRPGAWKGKYDSPTPPVCPEDASTPKGWTWITVSQAMRERIVNGLSIKESATPTSVRALKLSAMSDQCLDFNDFRWLPIELSKVEDIVIREADFFVSRGNGSLELVGRGSPAQGPKEAVIFPDTMMRIRFSRVVNIGPWFHALWTTRLVRAQIEKRVKTTAGIYKMAQPELASISVPLPPLAEQARIVAEVDRHLSIIREVGAEIDANLLRAQALRQSVLQKSFQSRAL